MQEKIKNKTDIYASYILKTIDLPSFFSNLTGNDFKWLREEESAVCNCPMEWHKDKNASFHMNKMDDGVWVYHCFGCNTKGHVIKFYMDYIGEQEYEKAVTEICKRFNIINVDESFYDNYINTKNRINKRKELEMSNIVVSNQCRLLLRKNFEKHKNWVSNTYKKLNIALDEQDKEIIEKIGYEVLKRMKD